MPIAPDGDGALRVSGTRVTLDTLVTAYRQGSSAEDIARQFPVVPLQDVYTVIGYYLAHRDEVERYMEEGRNAAEKLRQERAAHNDVTALRERLLTRRADG